MNKYNPYLNPAHEPDENERAKMMFFNPFQASVLEGAPFNKEDQDKDKDIGKIVILSSN
ncbi:MAG TPA: hypothetical protein VLG38_03180 [Gammaproteobacteria bacterium]|nr:hypothetical protein [Gammaproteobacteria bacterium]